MKTVCTMFVHVREILVNAFALFLRLMQPNVLVKEPSSSGAIKCLNVVNILFDMQMNLMHFKSGFNSFFAQMLSAITCPNGQVFQQCGEACTRTCSDLQSEAPCK